MDYDKILEKLEEISIQLQTMLKEQGSGKKKMVVIVVLELGGLGQHN